MMMSRAVSAAAAGAAARCAGAGRAARGRSTAGLSAASARWDPARPGGGPSRRRPRLLSAVARSPDGPRTTRGETTKKKRSGGGDDPPPPPAPLVYAAVDHSEAYDLAVLDRHGSQLRLAYDEGTGKDDPPFDPFADPRTAKGYIDPDDLLYDDDDDEEDDDAEEEGGGALVDDESLRDDEPLADDDDFAGAKDGMEMGEEEEEEEEEDEFRATLKKYGKDGFPRRPKSELAALRAGLPAGGLFAVIDLNGSQEKVTVDDVVIVNRLKPLNKWAVGQTVTLTGEDILLVGSTHLTLVGLPGVKGAEVDVMVEEITKDKKIIILKKRRRKNSRRRRGFRRDVTMLRILDIRMPKRYADHEHKMRI